MPLRSFTHRDVCLAEVWRLYFMKNGMVKGKAAGDIKKSELFSFIRENLI